MQIRKIECPYCGAGIDVDEKNIRNTDIKMVFCTYCGKKIMLESDSITENHNINITQNINQHVTNDAEIIREQNRHNERKYMLLAACLIAILAFGGGVFYMHAHNNALSTSISSESQDNQDNKPDSDHDETAQDSKDRNSESNMNQSNTISESTSESEKVQDHEEQDTGEQSIESTIGQNTISELYSFSFQDYKQFETFWIDGQYRCPNDIPKGKYVLLSLFTPFADFLPSKDPDNMTWSQYALYREYDLNDGDYIIVDYGAILVPQEDVDGDNMKNYGVFEVGADLPAGEYKLTSNTDFYESEIVQAVQGICGGYQITKDSPAGELIKSNRLSNKSEYVSLHEGEYIVIINATMEAVN